MSALVYIHTLWVRADSIKDWKQPPAAELLLLTQQQEVSESLLLTYNMCPKDDFVSFFIIYSCQVGDVMTQHATFAESALLANLNTETRKH